MPTPPLNAITFPKSEDEPPMIFEDEAAPICKPPEVLPKSVDPFSSVPKKLVSIRLSPLLNNPKPKPLKLLIASPLIVLPPLVILNPYDSWELELLPLIFIIGTYWTA